MYVPSHGFLWLEDERPDLTIGSMSSWSGASADHLNKWRGPYLSKQSFGYPGPKLYPGKVWRTGGPPDAVDSQLLSIHEPGPCWPELIGVGIKQYLQVQISPH